MSIPAPLPSSTANWHWKNKNVTKWGKEWIEKEVVGLTVDGEQEGEYVRIEKVFDCDGDMELGQRKSKLITIFDCKLVLDWEGKAGDGQEIKGRLHIPEVSHEIVVDRLSEYDFQWEIYTHTSTSETKSLYQLLKTRMPKLLEEKFSKLPIAMLEIHGKDLTVSADPSRSGTPANDAVGSSNKPSSKNTLGPVPATSASAPAPKKTATNTATVNVEATFMAAADDLFDLLTNEQRIPMWTRNAAVSKAQPDTEYSLFGGGVKGKYILLTKPTEIIQSWALSSPTWPSGHDGTMTTTLRQSDDSTTVSFSLAGVPKGMEDEIKNNIEGYYVQGLKSIGYVQLYPSYPSSSSSSPISLSSPNSNSNQKRQLKTGNQQEKEKTTWTSYVFPIFISTVILVAAFVVPLVYSSPPPSPR